MEYRGPILLVFGMSLVMSPIAINFASTGKFFAETKTSVAQVDVDTGCNAQSLTFANGAVLCTERTGARERNRTMPGGAMFVSARD